MLIDQYFFSILLLFLGQNLQSNQIKFTLCPIQSYKRSQINFIRCVDLKISFIYANSWPSDSQLFNPNFFIGIWICFFLVLELFFLCHCMSGSFSPFPSQMSPSQRGHTQPYPIYHGLHHHPVTLHKITLTYFLGVTLSFSEVIWVFCLSIVCLPPVEHEFHKGRAGPSCILFYSSS